MTEQILIENKNSPTTNFLNILSIFVLYLLIHKYVLQDIFQYFKGNTNIQYFEYFTYSISVFLFILLMFSGYSISKGHIHNSNDTVKIATYIFVIITLVFSSLGLNVLYNQKPKYFYSILIGILLSFIAFMIIFSSKDRMQKNIFYALFIGIISGIILSFAYGGYVLFNAYPTYTVIATGIVILSIIFYALQNGLSNINISYIFDTIQNNINYLIDDYNNTSTANKMLILLQITILVLYFTFHIIFNSIQNINQPKGLFLQKTTVPLNETKMLSSYSELRNVLKEKNFDYNYSISMWFKINAESNIDTFVNLFSYGNNPKIEYSPINNKLRFLVKTNKLSNSEQKQIYITNDLLYQRWNHVVFNYTSGKLDIFINNTLVHSESDLISYVEEDSIIIGTNNNVSGEIKNIVYFKHPLSLSSIQKLYYEYENKMDKPLLAKSSMYQSLFGDFEQSYKSFDETMEKQTN